MVCSLSVLEARGGGVGGRFAYCDDAAMHCVFWTDWNQGLFACCDDEALHCVFWTDLNQGDLDLRTVLIVLWWWSNALRFLNRLKSRSPNTCSPVKLVSLECCCCLLLISSSWTLWYLPSGRKSTSCLLVVSRQKEVVEPVASEWSYGWLYFRHYAESFPEFLAAMFFCFLIMPRGPKQSQARRMYMKS